MIWTCECKDVRDTCDVCVFDHDGLEHDCCSVCGGNDFVYDSINWHSSCRNCGVVGSYEVDVYESYVRPSTYQKHNYFTNTVLSNAMNKGFKITREKMDEMERRFRMCVDRFYATYDKHKRKYMLNANFVLWKISASMNEDVTPYLKLPKKNTLKKLENLWEYINPFIDR